MNSAWKNEALSFEERAMNLVSQMTLEEKVSQMSYFSSALSRFGIPEYNWWNECLHGVARAGTATMFPQPIGMAASFDENKLYDAACIISGEARVKHHAAADMEDRGIYKGLTMWTPNINLFRDPRWGRGHETYGEDPLLLSRMGVSMISGLQGNDERYFKCIATAKHFAVHSGPESERHSFNAVVSKKDMAESYLPAFKAAVEKARVYSVMGAYNRVNGEAACASPTLLKDILRDTWGFAGYVVSDCGAIEDIYNNHKLVKDAEEASALAVNNGCDLCCGWVFPHLIEAVKRGLITEDRITQASYRLLLARFKLGMFDNPERQPYTQLPYELNDCAEHHEKSLDMACHTIVLLKNDGILPLDRNKLRTIAVIGPNADNRAALVGNYVGTPSETHTVLEGIMALCNGVRVIFAEGCSLIGGSIEESWGETADYRIGEALNAALIADVVVVVTGLTGEKEGEEGTNSGDRSTLDLPNSQRNLMDALATIHKPLVLINMTGSSTIFPHEDSFSAILQAWYPGQMGGLAVTKVLFGDFNPCARLPITFYKDIMQVPDFSDYSMKNRTYRFMNTAPAYPFGYGLSYTKFTYSALTCGWNKQGVSVTCKVKNVGERDGREVVQVYVRLANSPYDVPVHQLGDFKTIFLKKDEETTITLQIDNAQISAYDMDGFAHIHSGDLLVSVGGGQPDAQTQRLTGNSVMQATVKRSP
jgi:beta-glucosidase